MNTCLVLSCIDFRIHDHVASYMQEKNCTYYLSTLPGASLAFNKNLNWQNTFLDILEISNNIQEINQIYVIDHMDCRYYQSTYKYENLDIHLNNFEKIRDFFKDIKNLTITYAIINFDGTITEYT